MQLLCILMNNEKDRLWRPEWYLSRVWSIMLDLIFFRVEINSQRWMCIVVKNSAKFSDLLYGNRKKFYFSIEFEIWKLPKYKKCMSCLIYLFSFITITWTHFFTCMGFRFTVDATLESVLIKCLLEIKE